MKRGLMFLVVGVFQVSASTATFAQEKRYALESVAGLRLHNVLAEPAVLQSKKGVRLTTVANAAADNGRSEPDYLALLDDVEFSSGTIEAEVAGAPGQGAFEAARGYVGIAFRVQGDMKTYDAFYLRPTNGRVEDQERRNHSTQYVSHPEWTWSRLRSETPSKYESYVDLEAGAWTKIKIEVQGDKARLFVHGQEQPTLVVNDVKSGAQASGAVALWLGPGTIAHFRNLTVSSTPAK